jgi:hypothetical protein
MKTYGDLNMREAGIRLIGPMDLIPYYELVHMSDAAVGLVVMGSYTEDLSNTANSDFLEAWHRAYGADSYPDFMSAAGWDTMAGIFHVIKALHGNVQDGAKVVKALEGWSFSGPRGPIQIDPKTRDIIIDEYAEEVYKKPDGKLAVKILSTSPKAKDECKELKVGRCAQMYVTAGWWLTSAFVIQFVRFAPRANINQPLPGRSRTLLRPRRFLTQKRRDMHEQLRSSNSRSEAVPSKHRSWFVLVVAHPDNHRHIRVGRMAERLVG